MAGRTYRYFRGEPLYPFGFGLSYTTFKYSELRIKNDKIKTGEEIEVSVQVENTGKIAGEEVVQLYVTDLLSPNPVPIRSLQGFKKISLNPGEKSAVKFILTPGQLSLINSKNERVVEPGIFEISIGGKQPGFSGSADAYTTDVLTTKFEVVGDVYKIE
jgi:beta-glucosidase